MTRSSSHIRGVHRLARVLIPAVSALLIVLVGCAGESNTSDEPDPTATPSKGIIRGTVKIGPLCPVEPCQETPENPFAGRWVVIQTEDDIPIRIPIHEDGSFQSQVSPGSYRLDLSQCQYPTCNEELPQTVTIQPGQTAVVEIDIDTGIR